MTAASEPSSSSASAAFPVSQNVVAIASGKGGVGKTWFSATLASALAGLDRRVLLFDGDLGLANIDVQLGLTPEQDLGAVIAGRARLEEAVTPFKGGAEGKNRIKGGFDVLAGRSGSGALSALTTAELAGIVQGLHSLAGHYDSVIVDLSAGLDRAVTGLSAASGVTLVVVTEEPTSLTDAYAFIKVMAMRSQDADIRVVVNMAENESDGKRVYQALLKACTNFLDIKPALAGVIIRDPKVRDAVRHQTPLYSRHPKSEAGAAVKKLAAQLVG